MYDKMIVPGSRRRINENEIEEKYRNPDYPGFMFTITRRLKITDAERKEMGTNAYKRKIWN